MDLTPGAIVAERFRLVRPLGQGGMGAVWEAVQTALDTPCALKFIHEEAARSPELRARFEREAKAAAQLRSPHVVQILDHGVWEGRPYIAMELLEGEDLARRLRRRRPLEPREVVMIAAQVGRALTKAHAAGLVHRDLKPANIFLVKDDDREIAKVLDFGVAKSTSVTASMTSDAETKTGAILGTPFYMSPEQARGNKDIDHRADLWALAVVVYQCVTGKLPFRSEALGDLLVKIIVEPLPIPSSIGPVPPGFDAWWKRAADREITQRFQTAKDLTDSLGMALDVTVPGTADVGALSAAVAQRESRASHPGRAPSPDDEPATEALLGTGTRTPGASISGLLDVEAVPPAPLASRAPIFAAVGICVALVGGILAFVALRSPAPSTTLDTPSQATMPARAPSSEVMGAKPVPAPSSPPTAPPAATATASVTSVVSAAAPPVKPTSQPPPRATTTSQPATPAGSKPKTDFGI